MLGRLFGLSPAPAETSRVLELGCGDGANALGIAYTLPRARVVALDAAAAPIERGRMLVGAAGVANLDLLTGDLADVDTVAASGPFDYVIAHGVYSWIPARLRGELLECCRRTLTPHGIAYISYNAYPGSYLRDMARDILEYHLRGVSGPDERLARAHALIEAIIAVESPTPYARVLREHLQRMLGAGDALLYHDELAPISTPFYFHEFMEHAAAHELQFLSEADLSQSQIRDVPASVGELVAGLGSDVIAQEQYLDFFRNRMFRQTLLTHASAPVVRVLDDRRLEGMVVSSAVRKDGDQFVTPEGATLTTSDPLLVATMSELGESWPALLPFGELVTRVAQRLGCETLEEPDIERLREALLHMYIVRLILLHACALPVCATPGERPQASALARAQHAMGRPVLTTLLGGNCVLDEPLEPELLPLLDGSRDRTALAEALDAESQTLEGALASLAGRGLIVA